MIWDMNAFYRYYMRTMRTNEDIIECLSKYDSLSILRKEDLNLYNIAIRRGLHSHIPKKASRAGEYRRPYVKRTDEDIIKALSKYYTIKDIREKDSALYSVAIRRGLSGHFPDKATKSGNKIYSDEDIIALIESCECQKEFIQKHKRLNSIINSKRKHLKEYKKKLPYKILMKKKEKRPKLVYKRREKGDKEFREGVPNILTRYRKICLTLGDEKIYIGNYVDDATRKKIIVGGYGFILKSLGGTE